MTPDPGMSTGRSALHQQGLDEGRRPDGSAFPYVPGQEPRPSVPPARPLTDAEAELADLALDAVANMLDDLAADLNKIDLDAVPPAALARHLTRIAEGLRSRRHTDKESPA